ncbi:Uncharacterized protein HZ326_13730 [Fusarium oxysporum f. sp. albedinis]|nr:Uncharacterized protein HZ326_13730 [Fusarium oxysporum f. sp. albedinis]
MLALTRQAKAFPFQLTHLIIDLIFDRPCPLLGPCFIQWMSPWLTFDSASSNAWVVTIPAISLYLLAYMSYIHLSIEFPKKPTAKL